MPSLAKLLNDLPALHAALPEHYRKCGACGRPIELSSYEDPATRSTRIRARLHNYAFQLMLSDYELFKAPAEVILENLLFPKLAELRYQASANCGYQASANCEMLKIPTMSPKPSVSNLFAQFVESELKFVAPKISVDPVVNSSQQLPTTKPAPKPKCFGVSTRRLIR